MVDRRVLFFGDSHVAGVDDPEGRGWVGRVVVESYRLGLPLTAYNPGVRGETSQQVAARWRAGALSRLTPAAEGRVVLSFGANDTTVDDGVLRRCRVNAQCAARTPRLARRQLGRCSFARAGSHRLSRCVWISSQRSPWLSCLPTIAVGAP